MDPLRLAAITRRIATSSRGTQWEGFTPPPLEWAVLPAWVERFSAATPPGALHVARSVSAALAEVTIRRSAPS